MKEPKQVCKQFSILEKKMHNFARMATKYKKDKGGKRYEYVNF